MPMSRLLHLPTPLEPLWMRACEQVPDDGEIVLACDDQGVYFIASYVMGHWESMEMQPLDVAWWMELPPPPALE